MSEEVKKPERKTGRIVISKSAKRKMTSVFEVNGQKITRIKANDFTEMVVYRTKLLTGKYTSVTRHEKVK